ncbi:hypothetical protein DPMN_087335 [Dreissena polymorpha]|uniref:Uncharacterized protein n=1 Tax=Dreissena polymorpha TaxID=45954 RepID=A0A9D4KU07_DREPO|nr:hypothetical protein DPMN_087335 [Dreissena polymorpha]
MSKCPSLLHYPVKPEIGIFTCAYSKPLGLNGSLPWLEWLAALARMARIEVSTRSVLYKNGDLGADLLVLGSKQRYPSH